MSPAWRRRGAWLIGVLLAPPVLLACLFALDRGLCVGQALRGVWVSDVPAFGLNRQEFDRALVSLGSRLRGRPLAVSLRGKLFPLMPDAVNLRIDRASTWARVAAAGRTGSWWEQFEWWLDRWQAAWTCSMDVRIDRGPLEALIKSWEAAAIVDPPFEGSIRVDNGRLVPQLPKPGFALEVGDVAERVVQSIEQSQQGVIELLPKERLPRVDMTEVEAALKQARALVEGDVLLTSDDPALELTVTPSELKRALQIRVAEEQGRARLALSFSEQAVDKLLAPILARGVLEARDATFEVDGADQVTIVPGQQGWVLAPGAVATALREAALTTERRGQLPLVPGAAPKLGTRRAQELKIRGLVAKFSTRHPCCRPRVKNIHRIAELLDGLIVLPGQTVSVNEVVGPRTEANGFVAAPSIEDGEMVDTVGGGISQFATTLFNAVLHGGYEIIERQPHTYYFDRYPMGHEATLSWPKPDLVFKNDTEAGLLIKTSAGAKSITVKLYGDNGGRKVETHVSAPRDIVQPPVELVGNPKLGIDRERVVDHGRIGWSVIAERRIVLPDGKKLEQKRRVTYKPETRVVEVHPCRIPEGEPGHTGKPCPVPEEDTSGAAGASGQRSDGGEH